MALINPAAGSTSFGRARRRKSVDPATTRKVSERTTITHREAVAAARANVAASRVLGVTTDPRVAALAKEPLTD
ncbi:hypothetical protein BKD30_01820 [Tersicoccus phoenicis]|uniref:Uncharacterized protein n=1 Tax=Tersicoccus phoenicis TaxID=554083 RepID=A0A1R1LLB7_9MICC|nr:hypothetical protein [Tersicoccus phoenicis]OMH28279.1 hypothetical protein BKD30_01820 [Tersicoccus phoenicis]